MSGLSAESRVKAFMTVTRVAIQVVALAGVFASVYVFNVKPVTRQYAPEQAVDGQISTKYFDSVNAESMRYCQNAILVLYGTGAIMVLCLGIALSGVVVGRYYESVWLFPALYIASNHINSIVAWSIHLDKYGSVLIPV